MDDDGTRESAGTTPGAAPPWGDIVWDGRLDGWSPAPTASATAWWTATHEPCQDSVLLEATNGIDWRWLDGDNRPWLASAPTLSGAWQKQGHAFQTPSANLGLFGVGSFIAADAWHALYTSGTPVTFPTASEGLVAVGGGNLIADRQSGRQYLAVEMVNTVRSRFEIHVFRAAVPNGAIG